ncbi:MAG: hypothetical protein JO017_10880, partial [Actinobacteria bacterium]|nr:hypothetical protein [Actinomycetota bacterium]
DEERVRSELAAVESGQEAKDLFAQVALAREFVEFLTLPAYDHLE